MLSGDGRLGKFAWNACLNVVPYIVEHPLPPVFGFEKTVCFLNTQVRGEVVRVCKVQHATT